MLKKPVDYPAIHADLLRRLPDEDPEKVAGLAAMIFKEGKYERGSFESFEYDPALARFAPRLFPMPTAAPNASVDAKLAAAAELERWITGGINDRPAPPPRKPKGDPRLEAAAELESRLAAALARAERGEE